MSERDGKRATILYVEDDDDTRLVMKQNLVGRGYRVLVDICEEGALQRAVGGRIDADLILMDLGMPPADVLASGHRIREATVLRREVPVVVIAYKYGEDMEGQDINSENNDWVTYLEDAEQLERLLARLLPAAA
jgi:CheY-like chemotaxis protein